jgi:hypothetical protein
VNQDSFRTFQLGLANTSRWLSFLAIIWLLSLVGLGWLVKSFLVIIGLIVLAPIIVFLGFRWWLQRNLAQDQCPVCSYEFAGLNKSQFNCPNCNEALTAEHGHFVRLTPPGTIDVQAVEVEVQPKQLES